MGMSIRKEKAMLIQSLALCEIVPHNNVTV